MSLSQGYEAAVNGSAARSLAVATGAEAIAMLTVVASFALSRQGLEVRWIYWCGMLGLFLVPAVTAVAVRLDARAVRWLLFLATAASYMTRVAYAPVNFVFPDEFAHLQTLDTLLRSHHLFYPNPSLPISPLFPGLELVIGTLDRLTGMPVMVSALVVLGIWHVLVQMLVLELLLQLGCGPRWALGGALVFWLNPQFLYIDSYFTYTAMALPIELGALVVAVRIMNLSERAGASRSRLRATAGLEALAVLLSFACVVTHHVTALVLAGILLLASVSSVLNLGARASMPVLRLTSGVIGVTAAWFATVGRPAFKYLSSSTSGLLRVPGTGGGASATPKLGAIRAVVSQQSHLPGTPRIDFLLETAGAVVIACALAGALLCLFGPMLRRELGAAASSLVLASPAYFVVLALRVLGGSPELSSRSFVYVLPAVGAALAIGLPRLRWVASPWIWRASPGRSASICLLLGVAWAGAVASSWPPAYARLPGPYQPGAWELSVEPSVLAAADWAQRHLPHDSRFVSDQMTAAVFAGAGDQAAVPEAAEGSILASTMPDALRILDPDAVHYVVLNWGITKGLPPDGKFFSDDALAGRFAGPVPKQDLTKFLADPRDDVVYANSDVAIVRVP